jgi:uncharacterized membrane protein YjgN (DUF898 family)
MRAEAAHPIFDCLATAREGRAMNDGTVPSFFVVGPPSVPLVPPAPLAPPELPVPPPLPAPVRFTGPGRGFRRLIVRGALLQVVTAGIYRFWLTTDARRFLWANTDIGGDSLEYSGTAMELFLGFLMAVALLVPVYVLLFVGSLELGVVSQFSSAVAFLFLTVFGQYAYYRARRYRLTRTIFRGIRLHQSGSAGSYALRSLLWWIAIAVTAGLAYPWAQASLERYKLVHTHYGDLDGKFAATGTSLFLRGIGLWLIFVVLILMLLGTIGYLSEHKMLVARPGTHESQVAGAIIGGITLVAMTIGFVVYATLQSIMMKWWLAGLRFGPLLITTTLKKRRIFGAYLRCLLYILLIFIALCVIFGVAFAAGAAILGKNVKPSQETIQILTIAGVGWVYLLLAVGGWIIYQMTIKLRIWRMTVDSVAVAGFDAIELVRADASLPSSAVGEGLADALGAGGI